MIRRTWSFLLAILFVAPLAALAEAPAFHVLAFYSTKVEPDHVDFATGAIPFFQKMAEKDHFSFEATTDWNQMNAENLKKYELVMFLDDPPSAPAVRAAFEKYMDGGGGWLGFHISGYIDHRSEWPWFADFMGTLFHSNNWPPLPAKLKVDDPSNPVMKGIPLSYDAPANEWYMWMPTPRDTPGIKVLLTLDPSNYPLGFKDTLTHGDVPVVWTNTKYRMIYANMGHGTKIFDSPVQNRLFENMVLWLGRGQQAAK